jgi:hypothetical protein
MDITDLVDAVVLESPLDANEPNKGHHIGGFLMGLKNDLTPVGFRADLDLDFSGIFWGGELIASDLPVPTTTISVVNKQFIDPRTGAPPVLNPKVLTFNTVHTNLQFAFYSDQDISGGSATVFDLPEDTGQPDGPPAEDDFDPETGVITNTKACSGPLLQDAVDGKLWLTGVIEQAVFMETLVLNSAGTSVSYFVGTGPAGVPAVITGGSAAPYFQLAALGDNFTDPNARFNFNSIPMPLLTNPGLTPLVEPLVNLNGEMCNLFDFRDSPDFQGFAAAGIPEANSLFLIAPVFFGVVGYRIRMRRRS